MRTVAILLEELTFGLPIGALFWFWALPSAGRVLLVMLLAGLVYDARDLAVYCRRLWQPPESRQQKTSPAGQ
jgi:hypothetical protein